MPEVSRVLGNREKFDATSFTDEAEARVSDIMAVQTTAPHLVTGFSERTRAFVEVQNGCDHRPTFGIIPSGRGYDHSVLAGIVDWHTDVKGQRVPERDASGGGRS